MEQRKEIKKRKRRNVEEKREILKRKRGEIYKRKEKKREKYIREKVRKK